MAKSMDTQLQNFWKESISKEAALRFTWHQRYSKQFSRDKRATKSADGADLAAAAAKYSRHTSVPSGNTVAERIRRLESEKRRREDDGAINASIDAAAKKAADSWPTKSALSLRDMRPPTAGTQQLLYSGISAHGEGRYAYLRKRRMLTPEKKYEFPLLSSCQYGWKIRDFGQTKSSPHARVCVIKDSFYRNSGIILG